MKIGFLATAHEVTGACHLAETRSGRFLVDCGMVQGSREAMASNREPFVFDVGTIDFVLLTHAHIDQAALLDWDGHFKTSPKQTQQACNENPDKDAAQKALNVANCQLKHACYYEEARHFSTLVSKRFQQENRRDLVVVTGGGSCIMEAANRGAFEADARSIGLNITLPHEQNPNRFITPELAFRFHYFAMRKMHFLMRAKALVAFPGGFGTFDELFGALTLIRKMQRVPVLLFGAEFWERAVNFDFLIAENVIAPEDRDLFAFVETAEQAIDVLQDFYLRILPE